MTHIISKGATGPSFEALLELGVEREYAIILAHAFAIDICDTTETERLAAMLPSFVHENRVEGPTVAALTEMGIHIEIARALWTFIRCGHDYDLLDKLMTKADERIESINQNQGDQ